MRWSLELPIASLIADGRPEAWTSRTLAEHPTLTLAAPDTGDTAVLGVRRDGQTLEVAVLATHAAASVAPAHPEWWLHDHLVVFVNPGHDHATRWTLAVDSTGEMRNSAQWIAPGEEPGEIVIKQLPPPKNVIAEFKRLDALRFFARIQIKDTALRTQPGTPLGMAFKVGFAGELVGKPLVWPAMPAWAEDTPFIFGDVFETTPQFQAEQLAIPEPSWGETACKIRFRGKLAKHAPREGLALVETILPDDAERYSRSIPWQAQGSQVDLSLPVRFSPRAKWSNDLFKTACLRLSLLDPAGHTLWSAEYPFGFDCGIIVRERFGPRGAALPARPSPASPNFLEEFRRHIYERIPDYRARSTRDGAPSDFFLEDPAGEAHLDFSAKDALDRWAALIAQRFPEWPDALCAVAAWINHPLITRHSAAWSRVAGLVSVASVPRLGGCFCSDTCRLGACLAEKVGAHLGVPLHGYTLGLRGHLATLVATPRGRVVIDGMLGLWFHTLDNSRLATLEEMRTEAAIVARVWYRPRAHDHEFFLGVSNQMIRRWEDTPFHWPETL